MLSKLLRQVPRQAPVFARMPTLFQARFYHRTTPAKVQDTISVASPSASPASFPFRYYSVSSGDIQEVTADQFLSYDQNNFQLIDVRQQFEWDDDHIMGAIHVPLDTILNNECDLELLRSKPCIVYCKAGIRSNMACTALRQFGVRAVNLQGGILAVREAQA